MTMNTPLPYTDLFIDFDDTLYDTHGNAIIALEEIFGIFHLEAYFEHPETFYKAYWDTNVELWRQYAHGEIERDYLIVERFRRPLSAGEHWPEHLLEEVDGRIMVSEAFCLEVSDRFLDCCATKPGVVDGAHELMHYLRQRGYRLHMASNGFHEVQYKKLKASNLHGCFDTVILSEDAGANKPSEQFFKYALTQTHANPHTTLMIGDNPDTDIRGAHDAGLKTLFFNRHANHPGITPCDYEVTTLAEIMEIL